MADTGGRVRELLSGRDVEGRRVNVLSLFSGIGGLDLGFKMAYPEAQTVMFVEIEDYCQKVLAKRFPGVPIWEDVYTLTAKEIEEPVDWIIGGFP